MKIKSLLIANRGEIAVRIIKTARRLGIRTVALFAEADRQAPHVRLADDAIFLGAGPVSETYLNIDKILQAMHRSGADAVHPGYGFVSENAVFAERVQTEGFIWVGPPVSAMRAMASKAEAKQTLQPKGVPMIPGYHGDDQSDARLISEASRIGFPLLVKASAGGGGKGMKVVEGETELPHALAQARREARSAFGDDRLLLEKYLTTPRHIEVQIMADQHGKVISLFERDCSVQRRHQKVLEEAPASQLPQATREAIWQAAETASREIGYQGAGTVEFILAATGEFYFLEMNTRLQVEHPVTELITGLDLVEWQLRVASGEALSIERPAAPNGHAIEVRLYAEDPAQQFMPMIGPLEQLSFPDGDGIRIDSGVSTPCEVSRFYDPMLAKIIVHGVDRTEALQRLRTVLAQTRSFGITTNLAFLRMLLAQPEIADQSAHTRWLDENPEFYACRAPELAAAWAALACVLHQQPAVAESLNAWQRHQGWRMNGAAQWLFPLSATEQVRVERQADEFKLSLNQQTIIVSRAEYQRLSEHRGQLRLQCDDQLQQWDVMIQSDRVQLDNGANTATIQWWQAELAHEQQDASGRVVAALPGTVTAIYKKVGEAVNIGDKILSFEAMKMEMTQPAEVSGVLAAMPWHEGAQIAEGDLLFEINTEACDV